MNGALHHVIVFGDNTDGLVPPIARLVRLSARSTVLKRFLDQAFESVRALLYEAREDLRRDLGEFHTLLDIAVWSSRNGSDALMVLEMPLLYATQLGAYMTDFWLAPGRHSATDPDNETLLGARAGMLSAASVACSYSLEDMLSIFDYALPITVRLGAALDRRAAAIAGTSSFSSVAVCLSPESVRQKLDNFNQSQTLPNPMRPFITEESASLVTVGAPGSVLESFIRDQGLVRHCRASDHQTGMATLHAADLPRLDVDAILTGGGRRADDQGTVSAFKTRPLLSPLGGSRYAAESRSALFHAVLSDLLSGPALWDQVSGQVRRRLDGRSARFLAVGSSGMGSRIYHDLRDKGCNITQPQSDNADGDEAVPPVGGNAHDIAIVGYSCRLPGAETGEDFWRILAEGRDVHGRMPESRCAGFGGNPPLGCFYQGLGLFDCRLFNMSPREAAQTDPGQRLLLMATYEALQLAGYSPGTTSSTDGRRVGTFFGQTTDDWREYNVRDDIDMFYVPGTIRAFGPGHLNYYFKWDGPSYSFDTACSSSSVAVQMACASLLARDCDLAVAGGLNTLTGPSMFAGLGEGRFLSTTGSCKTFDSGADGYCRADGVGVIALKRLDSALREGDEIYGVIKSWATNHSSRAISITQPHADTQARLFLKVLSEANLGPADITYVEMHGTGTPVGDTAELTSVLSVFGRHRSSGNPLYIGAAKANVGHGEAAAGITSIIKALLMFQHGKVPPHVGIKSQATDKLQALEAANIRVPLAVTGLGTTKRRKRIMVNNFSAAGGNTCLLLEEAPSRSAPLTRDPRQSHVVVLSAKTVSALKSNTARLLDYITASPGSLSTDPAELADIAYTTTARSIHHPLRVSYAVSTITELASKLGDSLTNWTDPPRKLKTPGVVLLFTGQGAGAMGMGRQLFATCSAFRESVEECDEFAKSCGYSSFLPLIRDPDGGGVLTPSPVQVQLAIVSLELALARLFQNWGVRPAIVCGHSLGEYAALCFSGVITTAAMIYLVGHRAQLVTERCSSGTHLMLAIRSPASSVEDAIRRLGLGQTEIACFNSPTDTVVAGPAQEIELLEVSTRAEGSKCVKLRTPYAFHTAQMDPILEPFSNAALTMPMFSRPTVPVASTVLGRVLVEAQDFPPGYLAQHCRQPVLMTEALRDAASRGIVDESSIWIECGPDSLCLPMVAAMPALRATGERRLPCLKKGTAEWQNLANILASAYSSGVEVNWAEYHKEYQAGLRLAHLPTYAFDLKHYWHSPERPAERSPVRNGRQSNPGSGPVLRSAVLHRVETDDVDMLGARGRIEFSSDLDRDTPLRTMSQGHVVDGQSLVPTSVYTEMALSAAFYHYQRAARRSLLPAGFAFRVSNLFISQPLVVRDASQGRQVLRTAAWSPVDDGEIRIEIRSCCPAAGQQQEQTAMKLHASCSVAMVPSTRVQDWRAAAPQLLQERESFVAEMDKHAAASSLLRQPFIYKIFRSIVSYDRRYFAMDNMLANNERPEAVSTFRFQPATADVGDDLHCVSCPYMNDSIAHFPGFVMNVLFPESADKAYISHGWETLLLLEPFERGVDYLAHSKVATVVSGTIGFTVSVFKPDSTLVAVCEDLRFREIDRKTLALLLRNAAGGGDGAGRPCFPAPADNARSGPMARVDEAPAQRAASSLLGVDSPRASAHQDSGRSLASLESSYLSDGAVFKATTSRAAFPARSLAAAVASGASPDERSTGAAYLNLILPIISSETGYKGMSWEDSTRFEELGVDSMISMSIIHQFHSQTGLDLPSTTFHEHPTVRELRDYLEENFVAGKQSTTARHLPEAPASPIAGKLLTPTTSWASQQHQPGLVHRAVSSHVSKIQYQYQYQSPAPSPPPSFALGTRAPPRDEGLFGSVLRVLCSEMGVTEEELDQEVTLQDLGLDSLLTIGVLARIGETLGWEPPSTFFIEHNTLGRVREALSAGVRRGRAPSHTATAPSIRSPSVATLRGYEPLVQRSPVGSRRAAAGSKAKELPPTSAWTAAAAAADDDDTLLAGELRCCGTMLCGGDVAGVRPLFLVPDGAGSGLAYVFLANALKGHRTASAATTPALYCLDSPLGARADEFLRRGVSVQQLAAAYVREVRRVQPRGPYRIAGWSIGGIHAFEMARQLDAAGETVELLCLIDSPCPTVLSACEPDVIFEGIGLDQTSVPKHLRELIRANLECLGNYHPPSRARDSAAATRGGPVAGSCLAIWAGQPAKPEEPRSPSPAGPSPSQQIRRWLLHRRDDFGPCGWDELTGGQVQTFVVPIANHFNIVKGDAANQLAAILASTL
ncbi:ketoacyl-synt-domain-containing protein [Colletotrichum sublineola]|nr:ketoacyl-synt-domain-containing protein [Colletotrichum sublineola]